MKRPQVGVFPPSRPSAESGDGPSGAAIEYSTLDPKSLDPLSHYFECHQRQRSGASCIKLALGPDRPELLDLGKVVRAKGVAVMFNYPLQWQD